MKKKDFTLVRGDTFNIGVTVTSGVIPKNISGCTIYLTVKLNITDTDAEAVIRKDITSHTSPATGKSIIPVTSTDTSDLTGDYYYDIQYKDTGSNIYTLTMGTLTFIADVTLRT